MWYGGQFYALFFLTQTLKVDATTAQIMIAVALAIGTPFFIFFGWLSDKIGRKPIMLLGFLLAVITYAPISPINIFKGITHYANPALEKALATSPVTVVADQSQCSFQFKMTGTEKFTTSCDVGQGGARGSLGELRQRACAGRHARSRARRRQVLLAARSPTVAKALTMPPLAKHGLSAEGRSGADQLPDDGSCC